MAVLAIARPPSTTNISLLDRLVNFRVPSFAPIRTMATASSELRSVSTTGSVTPILVMGATALLAGPEPDAHLDDALDQRDRDPAAVLGG